jgi:hypothetical protein
MAAAQSFQHHGQLFCVLCLACKDGTVFVIMVALLFCRGNGGESIRYIEKVLYNSGSSNRPK